MVWLKKKHAGNAPGYAWENDGDVVDVDEELALELLERPGDEFTEGQPPDADDDTADGDTGPDAGDSDDAAADDDGSTESKKPARTRRTKVSE